MPPTIISASRRTDIPAFCIRQQCSGFLYGLDMADALIRSGKAETVVVVGAEVHAGTDAFGFKRLGGVANSIGPILERLTGFETRVTVLGHLQRGGQPDRARTWLERAAYDLARRRPADRAAEASRTVAPGRWAMAAWPTRARPSRSTPEPTSRVAIAIA